MPSVWVDRNARTPRKKCFFQKMWFFGDLGFPSVYLFSLWTSWHLRFAQGPATIIIAEVVEWLISQADYNGPKQQCWLSLTNSSPILRRDKTTSKALIFITSQPNDTYKLQWSHSPIRQPTLWRLWRKILTIVLHSKVKKIEVSVDPSLETVESKECLQPACALSEGLTKM